MKADRIIKIPDFLHRQLQEYISSSHFKSIDDLVTFIVQDYLDQKNPKSDTGNKQDEEEVLKKLEDLGYM